MSSAGAPSNAEEKHFIVATAGHVDHGKSAIIKSLTGIDPDRLPEEKARGITIDLGFAHLQLTTTTGEKLVLGIVDVPGHEDFVKNMVAGVGTIDLALLIVAADDGWMPQTEEHLQILTYLRIPRAVVALTKIDLAENEPAVIDSIRKQLTGTVFAQAPIVPTSVINGRGMDELKQTLANALAATPPPRDIGKPRLPIDRVFTLRGVGTVVTGTLQGGNLVRGQSVVIQPAEHTAKIRTVQSHNHEVESIVPGSRTALNLPDLQAGETVQRGHVVALPGYGVRNATLDVLLEKSSRLANGQPARNLKDGALIRVHHGTGNVAGRVLFLERKCLAPGEKAIAQLRLDAPLFVLAGDRFIVRDWAEQSTLAGGIVLDEAAHPKNFRQEIQKKFLRRRAAADSDVSIFIESQLTRDRAVKKASLLQHSNFSAPEISSAADQLVTANKAVMIGEWIAEAEFWQKLRTQASETIQRDHLARPEAPGFPLTQLRTLLQGELPAPDLFDHIVAALYANGFVQAGVTIKKATHRPALPPHLQSAGTKLRALLSTKPFDPPSRKEIAPEALTQQALRFLLHTGEAIELGEDVVLLAESFSRASQIVKEFLRQRGAATVSDLRQALGSSRRVVVPFLERLDRDGITRREGDKRFLRS